VPYITGDTLIAGAFNYDTETTHAVFIDAKTGTLLTTMPFEPPHTKPYFKKGVMYCTTIFSGGQLLAYDIKNNTVLWTRFIAHGVDTQPVYRNNKIIANAEGDNWFELDYNNKLLYDCNNTTGFVEDITCVKNYQFLTHDGVEVTTVSLEKYFAEPSSPLKTYYTGKNTFVMDNKTLLVLDKKAKIKHEVTLDDIIYNLTYAQGEGIEIKFSHYYDVLKADGESVWLITNNILVVVNIKTGKATKTYNLTQWQPHQAVPDGKKLWVINRNDGQLYGLTLD
jgi:outer membrane protein assembly factor BamB